VALHGRATAGPHPLFEIVKTAEPEVALIQAVQHCPDVVIADYRMPRMDGIELLSRIRAQCPLCVSILMSGRIDTPALVAAVNQAGVYHFVGKPWDAEALRGVIAESLAYRDLIQLAR
jgi:response regulator RpfG family c-di-GMP phosphodiesterase